MTSSKKTEFHRIAKSRGWLLSEIGERWGVTIRQMSRIANNPSRKDLDAVSGLPDSKDSEVENGDDDV